MFPYLVVQILVTLMTMILGILLAATLFRIHHSNDGYFVSFFVLLTLVLSLYFWKTVNKAYVLLGREKESYDHEIKNR